MKVVNQLEELMQNVLESLKDRWDFYRHTAYLKKRGWTEEVETTRNKMKVWRALTTDV
jgi:hypothetical protein